MALTMGIGLQPGRARGAGTPPPPGPAITLAAPPRDRFVYDVFSAARAPGADPASDAAPVPVSGTAPAGTVIDLRVQTEAGAQILVETAAAQADAQGAWSAVIDLPVRAGWQRLRARAQGGAWTAPAQDHRIGAGDVVVVLGQSDLEEVLKPQNDQLPPEPVADPEAVQVVYNTPVGREVTHRFVADGEADLRHGLTAMANQWIALAPGRKLNLILLLKSGTGVKQMLDDDPISGQTVDQRLWANDKAAFDYGTGQGATAPGLAYFDWHAAMVGQAGNPDGFLGSFFPELFGVDIRGDAASEPGNEHDFRDLFGTYARTRVAWGAPRRREDLSTDSYDRIRLSIRDQWNLPAAAGRMLPPLFETLDIANGEPLDVAAYNADPEGYDRAASGWTDGVHPSNHTEDGIYRYVRYTALNVAAWCGHTDLRPVGFDWAIWDPAGIRVGVAGRDVSTERLDRGAPALDGQVDPRWTEVMGFRVSGAPADDAVIAPADPGNADPRLRHAHVLITPAPGTSFDAATTLSFGEFSGQGIDTTSGAVSSPEEHRAKRIYLNYPIVSIGAPGAIGKVAALALPDAPDLANTLGGGASLVDFTAFGAADATTGSGGATDVADGVRLTTTANFGFISFDATAALAAAGVGAGQTVTVTMAVYAALPGDQARVRCAQNAGLNNNRQDGPLTPISTDPVNPTLLSVSYGAFAAGNHMGVSGPLSVGQGLTVVTALCRVDPGA